jgi:hypothetical protein
MRGHERIEGKRSDNKPDPADPSIFLSVGSLLDVEEPNRPDLWEGEIPQGALVGISGLWGSMKSYLMQALGLRAAQGLPFLDRRLLLVHVFYFDRENPKSVWRRRLTDLAGQDRPERFHMMTLFGPVIPPAFDTDGVAFYSKLAASHPDSLFIFDSLVRYYPSGKQTENTEDAIHAMTSLKSFTRWGTTVSFLHHPTKSGGDFRGGGDLQAAPDLLFTLTHDKKAKRLKLECTKNRFEEEHMLEVGYEQTPEGGLVFVNMATDEERKRRAEDQERIAAVLEIIKELHPKGESTKRRLIAAGKERLKVGQKTVEHILDNGVDVTWTCTKTSTSYNYAPLYLSVGVHPHGQNTGNRSHDKGNERTSDEKTSSGYTEYTPEESVPAVPPPSRGSTEYTHGATFKNEEPPDFTPKDDLPEVEVII